MTPDKQIQDLVEALDGHKKAIEATYRIGKDAAADRVFVSAIHARAALKTLLAENKRYREALEWISFASQGELLDHASELATQALNPSAEEVK